MSYHIFDSFSTLLRLFSILETRVRLIKAWRTSGYAETFIILCNYVYGNRKRDRENPFNVMSQTTTK